MMVLELMFCALWELTHPEVFRPFLGGTTFEIFQGNGMAVANGPGANLLHKTWHSLLAALADDGTRPP